MNRAKPQVEKSTVKRVVQEQIGRSPDSVEPVTSGMIAATFECIVGEKPFIVQFNEPIMARGVVKERLLMDRLQMAGVPMRKIIGEGIDNGLQYTISAKSPGQELNSLAPDEFKVALASVFKILSAIASVNVKDSDGYGWFDKDGRGAFRTWKEHLCQIRDEEPGMFYDRWHVLFETSFLERDKYEEYFGRMARLLDSFSTPRGLVHGGFGYDNVLVDRGEVTAVLDWGDARYGDPLFDLAYMDFWPSGFDLVDMYKAYSESIGIKHDNYKNRILCYKYYIGLDSMRFFAKTNDKAAYNMVARILARQQEIRVPKHKRNT
jgi:hygromycin-B 4-O-kinase